MNDGKGGERRWRWGWIGVAAGVAVLALWMIQHDGDPLQIGNFLAPMPLQTEGGPATIRADSLCDQVIMIFSWTCPHCLRQLDLLEAHIEELKMARLVLIATDGEISADSARALWPRLMAAGNVLTGRMEKNAVRERFGRLILPHLVFVGRDGIVKARRSGTTTISTVISVLEKI
ncbi:MAG TPA: hypothetical protein VMG09_07710 [Bacteroidota bacterium]|nr:hypothetical protein [Bacteroidota bacterium]